MGTSHRHSPGVTGNPNWGHTSASITSIAKAISDSNDLDDSPPNIMSPKLLSQKYSSISKRISRNYCKAVRSLVRAAGGRVVVSSGKSKAIGRAGVDLVVSWVRNMQEISEQGLKSWLKTRGVNSLDGKSCHDVIGLITEFSNNYFLGLDDTAAREALSFVMGKVEEKVEQSGNDFDVVFNGIMSTDEIKGYIDQFFGMYIFSHISQSFSEKLTKERGVRVSNDTMLEIRDLILDDVSRGVNGKQSLNVDWNGEEGESFIKQEFDRILLILMHNED